MTQYTPGTLDRKTGKIMPDIPGLYLSNMVPISELKKKFGYLTVSRTLGYQGIAMDARNLMYHFFDAGKKYLETIDGEQYRRVYPPENAEFMQVTVWSKNMPEEVIQSNFFKLPLNCYFENLLIQNARCVGMAPSAMHNMKIANCTFVRSGESLAQCAFDAEDGWDMMQDVWIYRNRFIENPQNELLTCAGNNFIIEENQGVLYLWSRTNNYVLRNNIFPSATLGYASRLRTGYCRMDNNEIRSLAIGDNGEAYHIEQSMEQYGRELQGKGEVLDNRRAMTSVQYIEDTFVRSGNNGFFVGSILKNCLLTSTPNLYRSLLKDTTIKHFGAMTAKDSAIINGELTLYNCKKTVSGTLFKNTRIYVLSMVELNFENCTFENSTIHLGYWCTPNTIKLENCTVKNQNMPLLDIPTYSIKEIVFRNTEFDMTDASPVFLYDLRKSGPNGEPGSVRFEQCTIKNQAGVVIGKPKRHELNEKPLTFELKSTVYSGKFMENPEAAWTLTEQPSEEGKNGVTGQIGCDPGTRQYLEKLIAEEESGQIKNSGIPPQQYLEKLFAESVSK